MDQLGGHVQDQAHKSERPNVMGNGPSTRRESNECEIGLDI